MNKTTKTIANRGFATLTGAETRVEWTAAGNVKCVAERRASTWALIAGPASMVGRQWRHLRDLRAAVNGHGGRHHR